MRGFRSGTCRTLPATPTPAPPAATTDQDTTSTGTPPTPWPADSAAELIKLFRLMSSPARRESPFIYRCGRVHIGAADPVPEFLVARVAVGNRTHWWRVVVLGGGLWALCRPTAHTPGPLRAICAG